MYKYTLYGLLFGLMVFQSGCGGGGSKAQTTNPNTQQNPAPAQSSSPTQSSPPAQNNNTEPPQNNSEAPSSNNLETSNEPLNGSIGIEYDKNTNRAFLLYPSSIKVLNLSTGLSATISDANTGQGALFVDAISMELQISQQRLLVLDRQLDALISVDIGTGDRSVIASNTVGSGVEISFPVDIALDEDNDRLFLLNALSANEVGENRFQRVVIDLSTGHRRAFGTITTSISQAIAYDNLNELVFVKESIGGLSVYNANTGEHISSTSAGLNDLSYSLEVDSLNNQIFLAARRAQVIQYYSIQALLQNTEGSRLEPGQAGIFSESIIDPILISPRDMALDSDNNRLIVADFGHTGPISIDLNSEERSLLSGRVGSGAEVLNPISVSTSNDGNQLFSVDLLGRLFSVDTSNGNRSIVLETQNVQLGQLDVVDQPKQIIYSIPRSSLVDIVSTNLTNGESTVISNNDTRIGPRLFRPGAVVLDASNNRLILSDSFFSIEPHTGLVSINTESGELALMANSNSGPDFSGARALSLDSTNSRIFGIDTDKVIMKELISGSQALVSDSMKGSGPLWTEPLIDVEYNSNNNQLFVLDNSGSIYATDIGTGNRVLVSGENKGNGPQLPSTSDISYDPLLNTLYAADTFLGIVSIDPQTGNRTTLSH